jgi:flagellar L-ring protein precursor FlgH
MRHMLLSAGLLMLPIMTAAAQDSTATDTTAAAAAPAAPAVRPLSLQRASWLYDRQPLRIGDILTIVVDEQTRTRERTSLVAGESRRSGLGLNVGAASDVRLGPAKSLASSIAHDQRDVGEQGRDGDVAGTITVRVTELDALGNARVEGTKVLTVDGRKQEIEMAGTIRPDDVSAINTVTSSRVADAEITFKGKKIGAKRGILGNILSILWP